jgi:hypothetical protein
VEDVDVDDVPAITIVLPWKHCGIAWRTGVSVTRMAVT